jgi:predicted dehydrogenase
VTAAGPPRVAVIGVGGFGRHHARIYGELAAAGEARFVGVVDLDAGRRAEYSSRLSVPAVARVEDLPGPVDAVTVAVPTVAHASVAEPLLRRGVHCLVEKPIAASVAEAERLVRAAREGGAVLQVGHVERFNPVMAAVERLGVRPVFLEVHRLAPFSFRSADVGVVMDLMIHDLDIVLHLVGEEPSRVEAVGVPVLGAREDIANARLAFPSGAVANVTASRVSLGKMRKIRIFSQDAYVSLDYDKRQALLVRKSPALTRAVLERAAGGGGLEALAGHDFGDLLHTEMLEIAEAEPLKEEIRQFLAAARGDAPPKVSGEQGLAALRVAERVLSDVAARPLPARA